MKRGLLSIVLVLMLAITAFMPVSVMAAKAVPFGATGTITYVSPGDVYPAGKSDRWRVMEREMTGQLSGDLNGDFIINYRANIESVQTQAGNFHGTMTVAGGLYNLKLNGSSDPLEVLQVMEYPPGSGNYVPVLIKLTIGGKWVFSDAHGNGDFEGFIVFIPTPEGHVGTIVGSAFNMTGKWQP